MGNKILGTDIAGLLAKNLGPLLQGLALIKVTPGTRDEANPTAGNQPSKRAFTCRGISEEKTSRFPETIVQLGDRSVLILGDSLPNGVKPTTNDQVRLADGSIVNVVVVEGDPDEAAWTLLVRG